MKWKVEYTLKGQKRTKIIDDEQLLAWFINTLDNEIKRGNCTSWTYKKIKG